MSIPLTKPELTHVRKDMGIFSKVMYNPQVTLGHYVKKLEEEVCKVTHYRYAVAFNSGTSALTCAFKTLDSTNRSNKQIEVSIPLFTFAATVVATINAGLKPTFYDVDNDGNILPEQDLKEIVCPVDIFGLPANLDNIYNKVDDAFSLRKVIQDSAQSLGNFSTNPVTYNGDMCMFSMSPTKPITAIEGGVITTDNKNYANTLCKLRRYGLNEDQKLEYLGGSYRMSELHALVGYTNLVNRKDTISKRREVCDNYVNMIIDSGLPIEWFPLERNSVQSSCAYFVLRFPNEKLLLSVTKKFEEREIGCKRYFHPSFLEHPLIQQHQDCCTQDLITSNAHVLCSRCLAIPLWSTITMDEQKQVIQAIKDAYND